MAKEVLIMVILQKYLFRPVKFTHLKFKTGKVFPKVDENYPLSLKIFLNLLPLLPLSIEKVNKR